MTKTTGITVATTMVVVLSELWCEEEEDPVELAVEAVFEVVEGKVKPPDDVCALVEVTLVATELVARIA